MKTMPSCDVSRHADPSVPTAAHCGATRRQAVAGGLLAAAALATLPPSARASEGDAAADSGATGATGADDTSTDAATLLNDVAYPEPIASQDYDQMLAVDDDNPLDEDFLAGLESFASNLACYGLAEAAGLADTSEEGCLGQVQSDAAPNVCLSPASLYLALALLAQGAAGDTQAQLLDALGMGDAGADGLATQCGNLIRVLWAHTTPDGDEAPRTLQVANSVWLRSDVPFEQAFLDTAATSFYAECYGVAEPDAAAGKAMGAWIAEHTGGTLEPTLALDDSWIASLINTVWFKDAWSDAFNENDTEPDTFHAASGDVECDFMTLTRTCTVAQSAGCRVASLPLASGARVTFVLPDEGVDVRSLFARSAGVGMLWAMDGTSSEMVEATFTVPKVSFDTTTKLVEVCRRMGVVDAFDSAAADLSALTSVPACVSQVDQGTHFAMDENGVEASAYTVVSIEATGALIDLERVEFRLDRPFAFRLSAPNGVALFVGIVGDPTQA